MAFNLDDCAIDDCGQPAKARGWCSTHVQRFYRTGSPHTVRKSVIVGTLEDRVWGRIERTDNCWLWTGSTTRAGYGNVGDGGRILYVHRLICEWFHGPPQPGLEVLHSCDNRVCVNPDHLSWGTRMDNVQDMIGKGRAAWQIIS